MQIRLNLNRLAMAVAKSGLKYREIDERAQQKAGWMSALIYRLQSSPDVQPATAHRVAAAIGCEIEDIMDAEPDQERQTA